MNEVTDNADRKILNEVNGLVQWGNDSMKLAQRTEATIGTVIKWVKAGKRPESSRDLTPDEKTYFHSVRFLW